MYMKKYQLLENQDKSPLTIPYGDLGICPVVRNKHNNHLGVLKIITPEEYQQETSILQKLTHINILGIRDKMETQNQCVIVLQFAPNGDLYSKIQLRSLSKQKIRYIFKGVAEGLNCIHSNGYIHRNLKPQNVMLGQNMVAKLMDFGMAVKNGIRKTVCGCFYYMAPEILIEGKYDNKVDIWALGVILYEMFESKVPYDFNDKATMISQINKPLKFSNKFEKTDRQAIDLIQCMLRLNKFQRIDIKNVLKHPYCQQKIQYDSSKISKEINYTNKKDKQYIPIKRQTISPNICQLLNQKIQACNEKDSYFAKYNFTRNI